MANYINKTTKQYPVTEQDIRNQNPNTSFSIPFIAPEEYALVFDTPKPEHNVVIQIAREIAPVLTKKGTYEQKWEIVSKFVEYTDEAGVVHTVADQEAAAIAADQEAKDAAAREEAKRKREEAVANIKVTTSNGNTFDGDEASQGRMSRAIIGLMSAQTEATGVVTIKWVLADNTIIDVDATELTEALTLAGKEQANLWVI